jgi:hypothetical protein
VCRLHEEIELFAQRATPTAKERLAMEAAVEVRARAPTALSHVSLLVVSAHGTCA